MIRSFVLPIVVTFAIIIFGIIYTGMTNPDRAGTDFMSILMPATLSWLCTGAPSAWQ